MLYYNDSKTVRWNMNSESDLAGYIVYYGTQSHIYTSLSTGVGLAGGGTTGAPSQVLSGLQNGQTYYVAVTAYDLSGNESTFSAEVSTTINMSILQLVRRVA